MHDKPHNSLFFKALEFTGGVPYQVLKPVFERATPVQLFELEKYNEYLLDDTDELWRNHCGKDFRNKQRDEDETWREMYLVIKIIFEK